MINLRQQQQHQDDEALAIHMSVLAEGNEQGAVEHGTTSDGSNKVSFKSLHVTASSKTKQFCLRVNIGQPSHPPFATCFSSPISIISKPSKKTRHDLNGILTTSQISLYSRINSQTVRTKYLTSDQQTLCAKHSSWSAFDIIVIHQSSPQQQQLQPSPQPSTAYYNQQQYHPNHQLSMAGIPLTYGSEIVLKDSQSGACSPHVIIRKVDKSSIAMDATGPVSQMQKVALQLTSSVDNKTPLYLSSNGPAIQGDDDPAATWLDQAFSKRVDAIESVDDCFCWTIVGIAKFECTMEPTSSPPPSLSPPPMPLPLQQQPILPKYHRPPQPRLLQPSPPPSPPRTIMPFPRVASAKYDPDRHLLHLVGQHLPSMLEFWLGGAHGPLRILQQQGENLSLALPHTHDFLVTHHDLLIKTPQGGHSVVFPLLMIRKDRVVTPTGQSIGCHVKPNGDALWTVLS
jgi:hypothetical protein